MKLPLGVKILGSFSLIVFLALSITVLANSRFMREYYNDFSRKRDIAMARTMSPVISEWMQQIAESDDISYNLPPPPLFIPGNDGHRHGMRGGRHIMPRNPWIDDNDAEEFDFFKRVLVTDAEGHIVFNTIGYRQDILENQTEGIGIMDGESLIGYLYLDWMVPRPGSRADGNSSYFRRIDLGVLCISFIVFLFAMGLGLLLTRHIVSPIKQLNRAIGKVGEGNLDTRVEIKRRDEMGDLAKGFNDMTTALQTADTQRRRFIADSAHELRTPISLIRTRIEMMEEGVYPLDRDGLNALAGETDRMIELIEELKTLSSLESNDFSMKTETLDLVELVRITVEAGNPVIENSGLTVETIVSGIYETDKIWVIGHSDRLARLIRNLLTNALQYAHSQIIVHIGKETAGKAFIRVEDDGPGIPEHERKRVFERFYRLDSSRSRSSGGTGLGLAICQEIVRVHGGSIHLETSELGGAAFIAVLPI